MLGSVSDAGWSKKEAMKVRKRGERALRVMEGRLDGEAVTGNQLYVDSEPEQNMKLKKKESKKVLLLHHRVKKQCWLKS